MNSGLEEMAFRTPTVVFRPMISERTVELWDIQHTRGPTALQESSGFVLDLLGQLTGAFKVVQDEDVGGKQNHVLLPTAVRHGQQLVQVLHGPAHKIT